MYWIRYHQFFDIIVLISIIMLAAWEAISEINQSTCHNLFTLLREVSDQPDALDDDNPFRVIHLCQMLFVLHEILIRKDALLLM